MSEKRVSLSAEDFRDLMAGKIVHDKESNVKVMLKDIGYAVMYDLLYKEMSGKGYVMVKPSEHEESFGDSCRTHETVKCENGKCSSMFVREVNKLHPIYCSNCYSSLNKS